MKAQVVCDLITIDCNILHLMLISIKSLFDLYEEAQEVKEKYSIIIHIQSQSHHISYPSFHRLQLLVPCVLLLASTTTTLPPTTTRATTNNPLNHQPAPSLLLLFSHVMCCC